jgi:vacuolar-type H+-ATPase subunit E/Vma4
MQYHRRALLPRVALAWTSLALLIGSPLGLLGCDKPGEKAEKAADKVKEKAGEAADKAKELGDKGSEKAEKYGHKAWKKTRRAAKKAREAARRAAGEVKRVARKVGDKAGEKTRDVANTRKCDDAYDHLKKCLPKLLEGVGRKTAIAKCAGALVAGQQEVKDAILCVADSGGDCKKVTQCKAEALKKGVLEK